MADSRTGSVDVRALLRSEREARRVTHPHATYSSTGTLICVLCQIQIGAESSWAQHLKSSSHAVRLDRASGTRTTREGAHSTPPPPAGALGHKRKNVDVQAEETEDSARKRAKGEHSLDLQTKLAPETNSKVALAAQQSGPEHLEAAEDHHANFDGSADSSELAIDARALPGGTRSSHEQQQPTNADTINEDEWAAFEREVVATPPPPTERSVASALTEKATIEAAPVSTAELAALGREQQTERPGQRDAEIEAEKEDAARSLEEEFEKMESLEERVRRLREKREALRRTEQPVPTQPDGEQTEGAGPIPDDASEDDFEEDYWEYFR